jgi:hypothetical protein
MVGQSPLTTRIGGAATFVVLLLGGCASPAPSLPPDTTGTTSLHRVSAADFAPSDMALSCTQIDGERADLNGRMEKANANIMANRHDNQVAGYFGATVMPLAYLATEGNYADKDAVKAAYARRDVLDKLVVLKGC